MPWDKLSLCVFGLNFSGFLAMRAIFLMESNMVEAKRYDNGSISFFYTTGDKAVIDGYTSFAGWDAFCEKYMADETPTKPKFYHFEDAYRKLTSQGEGGPIAKWASQTNESLVKIIERPRSVGKSYLALAGIPIDDLQKIHQQFRVDEKEFEQFLADRCESFERHKGAVDIQKFRKELYAYFKLLKAATIVYHHVTGGMCDNPNLHPAIVVEAYRRNFENKARKMYDEVETQPG